MAVIDLFAVQRGRPSLEGAIDVPMGFSAGWTSPMPLFQTGFWDCIASALDGPEPGVDGANAFNSHKGIKMIFTV